MSPLPLRARQETVSSRAAQAYWLTTRRWVKCRCEASRPTRPPRSSSAASSHAREGHLTRPVTSPRHSERSRGVWPSPHPSSERRPGASRTTARVRLRSAGRSTASSSPRPTPPTEAGSARPSRRPRRSFSQAPAAQARCAVTSVSQSTSSQRESCVAGPGSAARHVAPQLIYFSS